MYVLRDNGPKMEILKYPNWLSILYKISWKNLPVSYLRLITILAADLKQTGAISVPPFSFYFLNKVFTVIWYFRLKTSYNKSLKKIFNAWLVSSNWTKGWMFFTIILIITTQKEKEKT